MTRDDVKEQNMLAIVKDARTAAVLHGAELRLRRLSKRRSTGVKKQAYREAAELVHRLIPHRSKKTN